MKNDFFLTMFFSGLYPTEEQHKIDLWSISFYSDALDFYYKKANEDQRNKLIKGIMYLSVQVRIHDEIKLAQGVWNDAMNRNLATGIFAGLRAKKDSKPDLVKQFKDEVSNILEAREIKLYERRVNELNRLRKKAKDDKILIDSLIDNITNKNLSQITPSNADKIPNEAQIPANINNLVNKVSFPYRGKFKDIIEKLSEGKVNLHKCNKSVFATVAVIFYCMTELNSHDEKKRWISDLSYTKWLKMFSEAYNRKGVPTTKKSQAIKMIYDIIKKEPQIDILPDYFMKTIPNP